jgi:hypothetical protein
MHNKRQFRNHCTETAVHLHDRYNHPQTKILNTLLNNTALNHKNLENTESMSRKTGGNNKMQQKLI